MIMEQKRLEAFQFEEFCQRYFSQSIVFNQPEPPDPDISFHWKSVKIGCELTTIYPDSKREGGSIKRKNESLFKQLCRGVEKEVIKSYPKGYIITFRFNFSRDLRIDEKDHTIMEIASELCSHINNLKETNHSKARFEGIINHHSISDQIQIRIFQYPEIDTYINPSYGSFVPKLNSQWLYHFVENKEKKTTNYITAYNQLWLLLISQEGLSSDFEIINQSDFDGSRFLWDKIFLYQMFGDRIIELK